MNQNVYGTIDSSDKEDYFEINLPTSGTIKITFANDRFFKTSWNSRIGMDIYNGYFEPFGDTYFHYKNVSVKTTKPESFTINLKKGTNYIRVVPNSIVTFDEPHPYHFKLSYVVPGTTIKKAASAKKAFTVKWTKKSGAAKYQIRYSTKKSMSGAKTVNVSKAAKSKKVKGLKSGKNTTCRCASSRKSGGSCTIPTGHPRNLFAPNKAALKGRVTQARPLLF